MNIDFTDTDIISPIEMPGGIFQFHRPAMFIVNPPPDIKVSNMRDAFAESDEVVSISELNGYTIKATDLRNDSIFRTKETLTLSFFGDRQISILPLGTPFLDTCFELRTTQGLYYPKLPLYGDVSCFTPDKMTLDRGFFKDLLEMFLVKTFELRTSDRMDTLESANESNGRDTVYSVVIIKGELDFSKLPSWKYSHIEKMTVNLFPDRFYQYVRKREQSASRITYGISMKLH